MTEESIEELAVNAHFEANGVLKDFIRATKGAIEAGGPDDDFPAALKELMVLSLIGNHENIEMRGALASALVKLATQELEAENAKNKELPAIYQRAHVIRPFGRSKVMFDLEAVRVCLGHDLSALGHSFTKEVSIDQFAAMVNWILSSQRFDYPLTPGDFPILLIREVVYETVQVEFPGGLKNFSELFPGE